MDVLVRNQIFLTFGGTLAPNNSVSLRTLSYTIPHFQRAIDKTVYFNEVGEIRKFSSLPSNLHEFADFYIDKLEEGSLRIPFLSKLVEGVPQLYANFLAQPYEQSAREVVAQSKVLTFDLESNKVRAQHDNLDEVTQENLIEAEGVRKQAYAQTAVLKDMSYALSVVRTTPGALLDIGVNTERGFSEFSFDQQRATRFAKIATTQRLADPAIYVGRITGLERIRATGQLQFAAKFLSRATGQENKLFIADYEDALRIHPHNLRAEDIVIWASPIAIHNSFDPVRGDIVFVDFASQL